MHRARPPMAGNRLPGQGRRLAAFVAFFMQRSRADRHSATLGADIACDYGNISSPAPTAWVMIGSGGCPLPCRYMGQQHPSRACLGPAAKVSKNSTKISSAQPAKIIVASVCVNDRSHHINTHYTIEDITDVFFSENKPMYEIKEFTNERRFE